MKSQIVFTHCDGVRPCYVSWKGSSNHLFAIDDTPLQSSGSRAECTQCNSNPNSLHSTFEHSAVAIPVEVQEALDSFDWDASVQNIGRLSEIGDSEAWGARQSRAFHLREGVNIPFYWPEASSQRARSGLFLQPHREASLSRYLQYQISISLRMLGI
jgi:hypothetical protein